MTARVVFGSRAPSPWHRADLPRWGGAVARRPRAVSPAAGRHRPGIARTCPGTARRCPGTARACPGTRAWSPGHRADSPGWRVALPGCRGGWLEWPGIVGRAARVVARGARVVSRVPGHRCPGVALRVRGSARGGPGVRASREGGRDRDPGCWGEGRWRAGSSPRSRGGGGLPVASRREPRSAPA